MITTMMIAAALSVRIVSPTADSYVSGSTAPTNSSHDGTLRQLNVEVDGRHRIRAREAYRASNGKQ
jgi:hypothetical protein